MNRLEVTIKAIQNNGNLHLVTLDACGTPLIMLGLELPISFELEKRVNALFKPSSVVLAKDFSGDISLSNRIECEVKEVDINEILAEILLGSDCGDFYSLITRKSCDRMGIKFGDRLVAMIKATEVSLGEI